MLNNILHFLLTTVTSVVGVVLLLRAWVFVWALSPRHPLVEITRKFTDWLVDPLSKVLPRHGAYDWPSLVGALLIAALTVLIDRAFAGLPMTPFGIALAPVALTIRWGLEMISWGVLIWVVLSWLNPQSPMMYLLSTLLDPFVRPVRRVLPRFGRFDFSPVVVIIVANVLLILITPVSHGFMTF